MQIEYIKIDPTKNITLLVLSSVSRRLQPFVAKELLSLCPDAEQVGFIEEPNDKGNAARLQMMGGEFCGNATMSLGVYLANQRNIQSGESEISLEVSGFDGPVSCRIKAVDGSFFGTVAMPAPQEMCPVTLSFDGKSFSCHKVVMPGITHLILPSDSFSNNAQAEKAAREWCTLFKADAAGLIFYDENLCRITPLIYVRETDSLVWEKGCGSGSAAIGCFEAAKRNCDVRIDVLQPGGTITVERKLPDKNNPCGKLFITGKVKICGNLQKIYLILKESS